MNIRSKLPDVGTTIFTVMSRMAADFGAINLSQGFPDFPVDKRLTALVSRYMDEGYNQYAPMAGLPELLEVVGSVVSRTYGFTPDTEKEITITAGATEALFSSIAAFVHRDEEVIMFDPSYDLYDPAVRLCGGKPVRITLRPPDFAIDWERVEQSITPRTRMIMINTPHNPTGRTYTPEDLQALERLALQHGLIVLSDEAYERIIFDAARHESVLHYPALRSQSIGVFSFGKTFHATGWKIGYTVAPPQLTGEIRRTHQFVTFSINTPIQKALSEYLKDESNYNAIGSFYQRKRDFFLEQLRGSSFEPIPSRGTYFQLVSYKALSDKPEMEMAVEMTQKHKVACIPVSVFYEQQLNQQLLRFCFAKRDETLEEAGRILRKL
jgi:methionine aminotransferase